jgi:hypothetical protein
MDQQKCEHENIIKLEFVRSQGVHLPRTEVWVVKYKDCGQVYEEVLSGD